MKAESYRVHIGDREYDFQWDGQRLVRDGVPLDVSLARTANGHYSLLVDGRSLSVILEDRERGVVSVRSASGKVTGRIFDRRDLMLQSLGIQSTDAEKHLSVTAPMPGLIVNVLVKPGDQVAAGDGLLVLEAMKMENELRAAQDGVIASVHVVCGDAVGKNDLLIEFVA